MLKRIARLGAIAALTIGSPSHSKAQDWGGWGGWGGGVTVNVGFPGPRPFFPRPFCCRPRILRPDFCCRPFIPRPVFCCNRPFLRPWPRPIYYYGDNFAPWGYNWEAGYSDAGYYGGY